MSFAIFVIVFVVWVIREFMNTVDREMSQKGIDQMKSYGEMKAEEYRKINDRVQAQKREIARTMEEVRKNNSSRSK